MFEGSGHSREPIFIMLTVQLRIYILGLITPATRPYKIYEGQRLPSTLPLYENTECGCIGSQMLNRGLSWMVRVCTI